MRQRPRPRQLQPDRLQRVYDDDNDGRCNIESGSLLADRGREYIWNPDSCLGFGRGAVARCCFIPRGK